VLSHCPAFRHIGYCSFRSLIDSRIMMFLASVSGVGSGSAMATARAEIALYDALGNDM
jgi:hypothetical protein